LSTSTLTYLAFYCKASHRVANHRQHIQHQTALEEECCRGWQIKTIGNEADYLSIMHVVVKQECTQHLYQPIGVLKGMVVAV